MDNYFDIETELKNSINKAQEKAEKFGSNDEKKVIYDLTLSSDIDQKSIIRLTKEINNLCEKLAKAESKITYLTNSTIFIFMIIFISTICYVFSKQNI